MAEALRSLLAELVVRVDPTGELPKGEQRTDALAQRIRNVASEAKAATSALDAMAKRAGAVAQGFAQRLNFAGGGRAQVGSWADPGGLAAAQRTRAADAAAAAYAQTLRGRLQPAIEGFRSSFGRPSGSGPGLLPALRGAWEWATSLRTAFLGLGLVAGVGGLARLVDSVGSIGEQAAKLGVTTDEFQRLSVLARQNNTNVAALGVAFRTLATNAVDPPKEAAEAFAQLGVRTRDANGAVRPTQELFFAAAEALADLGNETERTALAQRLFGRGALELKPLLAGGSAGIRAQREELAKLTVISEDQIAKADALSDRWAGLGASLKAQLVNRVFPLVLPVLERFTKWLGSKDFDAFTLKVAQWGRTLFSFGTVLAGAYGVRALGTFLGKARDLVPVFRTLIGLGGGWRRVLGSFAGSALKFGGIGALLIALEDLMVFLRGGDSLIGRGLDKLFGKGSQQKVLEGLTSAMKQLVEQIKEAINLVADFWNSIPGTPKIGKFGTQLSRGPGALETEESLREKARLGIPMPPPEVVAGLTRDYDKNPLSPYEVYVEPTMKLLRSQLDSIGQDNRTQNVTVNVGSAAEVQQAVAGAQRGLGARTPQADLNAVRGD